MLYQFENAPTYIKAVVLRRKHTYTSHGVGVTSSSLMALEVPHLGMPLSPGQTLVTVPGELFRPRGVLSSQYQKF